MRNIELLVVFFGAVGVDDDNIGLALIICAVGTVGVDVSCESGILISRDEALIFDSNPRQGLGQDDCRRSFLVRV